MIEDSDRYSLRPLELATGLVLGLDPPRPPARTRAQHASPRAALEDAILPALRRAPCLVSFSGGRDSSAILALATVLARRHGLPPPIPATNRFPGSTSADESSWQEQVVSHLGIDDWVRLDHTDELDCIGPIAQDVLRRHGVLWPFNAHFHAPLLRLAAGGSLLTGIGGDEILSPSTWSRALTVLSGRARPEPRDVLRVASALAPQPVRRLVLRRRFPVRFQWLRPRAHRKFEEAWSAQRATEPLRWAYHLDWVHRLRYIGMGIESIRVMAEDDDVYTAHPFLGRGFADSLAALPRQDRFRSRTQAMRAIFEEVLPDDVIARASKASFDDAFWSESSRRFAASWDGKGVDPECVDAEALAREWTSTSPDPRSYLLLQAVWLGQEQRSTDRFEQTLDRVGQ